MHWPRQESERGWVRRQLGGPAHSTVLSRIKNVQVRVSLMNIMNQRLLDLNLQALLINYFNE